MPNAAPCVGGVLVRAPCVLVRVAGCGNYPCTHAACGRGKYFGMPEPTGKITHQPDRRACGREGELLRMPENNWKH